jgi:hypothetical protein
MKMPWPSTATRLGLLSTILFLAALIRANGLGRLSFWYDEVISMRLARAGDASALVKLLNQIDASRAPLHPLVLQQWVRVLGQSEASARAFSVVCGVLSVVLIYRFARRGFEDSSTALWAAWLSALSPLLVLYAREARMYAWLVLVTCVAWDSLWSLRGSSSASRLGIYALGLAALVYSSVLGLFMAGALCLAALLARRALGQSWVRLLAVHLAAAALVAPWVGRYFADAPEWVVGRQPPWALLGAAIGFTGGNLFTLPAFAGLIGLSLVSWTRREDGRRRPRVDARLANLFLLVWVSVPPLLLYGYSRIWHPIFGPPRCVLFVAPAYLLLVARGLVKLPSWLGILIGAGASVLALLVLPATVYSPDLKPDWRAAAAALDRRDPTGNEPVLVVSADPARNLEVETARYYLGPRRAAIAMPVLPHQIEALRQSAWPVLWVAASVRDGQLTADLPYPLKLRRDARIIDVNGLRLIALEPGKRDEM